MIGAIAKRFCGWLLVFAGVVLAIIGVVAFLDPAGTQMADDGNPFGQPPSAYQSGLVVALGVTCCVWGRLIARSGRNRVRL